MILESKRINSLQRERRTINVEKEEENRERRKGHAVKRAKRIVKRWKAFDRWRSIPSQGFPCLSATTRRAALLEENERTLRRLQWRYFTGQVAERGMPDLSLCAQVRTSICVCVCVDGKRLRCPRVHPTVGRRGRNKAAVCKY